MRKTATVILTVLLSFSSFAQRSMSTQFLDNNPYAFRHNPAYKMPDCVIGVLVSDINVSATSSYGVRDFFFERNGKLVSGFDNSVSADEFLSNFKDGIDINAGTEVNVATVAWTRGKHHPVLTVDVVSQETVVVPPQILFFIKEDASGSLDMTGTYADVSSWLCVRGGDRIDINDKLTLGWGIRLLVSPVKATLNVNSWTLSIEEGHIDNKMDAELISSGLFSFSTSEGFTVNPTGEVIGGAGASFDAGIEWRPLDGLDLSFALMNFGATIWSYGYNGKVSGGSLDYSGETEPDYRKLYSIKEGTSVTRMTGLPWNINMRARYAMPFWKPLKLGVAYNWTRQPVIKDFHDFRSALTVTPFDWLSFTTDIGMGTYGPNCGCALSLRAWKFNLHAAIDAYIGDTVNVIVTEKDNPEEKAVPLPSRDGRAAANLGLSLVF